MTFSREELFQLAFVDIPKALTEKERKAFISMRDCFWHANMSGCETATFNLTRTELIALSKVERFTKRQENEMLEKSIRKKVEEELMRMEVTRNV